MENELKARILIVDDQPAQLLALETVLLPLQEHIVKVRSGKEALRHLLRAEYAVILLDVNMPEMDGFETAELIRQRKASRCTPIIFVTGHGLQGAEVARSYEMGAVDYIQTPVVPAVLRAKVAVFVDLYKHRAKVQQQARELHEHVVNLTALNAELEQFNYSISHDLRAPLRSTQGFAQFLMEEYGDSLPEQAKEYVRRICQSAHYMDKLLHDLLQYGRVSRSRLELEPVEIEPVLDEVLGSFRKEIEDAHAKIEVSRPLGAVIGHPTILKQVLANLIDNAIKFAGAGTLPCVRIYNEPEPDGGLVRLCVQDNGIGIPAEVQDKIFGLFERLHGAKEYPGTGIGLAIVRKAAERMDGLAGVESEPGKGSTFWVQLRPAEAQDALGAKSSDMAEGMPT